MNYELESIMKLKEPWRTIVQIIITVLTTLTTTSCMGKGPF